MSGLAERLREARERAGLSARGLDEKAGITAGHTTLIESGRRAKPTAEIVGKLAAALGVSIDWLVMGRESGPCCTDEDGPEPEPEPEPARTKSGSMAAVDMKPTGSGPR